MTLILTKTCHYALLVAIEEGEVEKQWDVSKLFLILTHPSLLFHDEQIQ